MSVIDSSTYRVNEIFYSLQGEGYFTGTPAVFLRLSGCNRKCAFCDTAHSNNTIMNIDEITAHISAYPSRHIVITGGEPSLQIDKPLLSALKTQGFFIAVETNGSMPLPPSVDWITCSPKDAPYALNRVDELKIVYTGQDVEGIAMLFTPTHLFLQPCTMPDGSSNIKQTIEYILEHPHWRLSLQTHKLINIR